MDHIMHSRKEQVLTFLLCLITILLTFILYIWPHALWAGENTQSGILTWHFSIKVSPTARVARLWVPYPKTGPYQTIDRLQFFGNYTESGIYSDVKGNLMVYARWDLTKVDYPELILRYRVYRRQRIQKQFPNVGAALNPDNFREFMELPGDCPVSDRIKELSRRITEGKADIHQKALAIYDWIINSLHRDPGVKGCGRADICLTLEEQGGKCEDISSLFVALARASGIPARTVFGLRLGKHDSTDLTRSQHCWAEYFEPAYGWVPVDPSDVLKASSEKGVRKDSPEIRQLRAYYFGALDPFRIALSRGKKITLTPPQARGPLDYFMYPYLEVDDIPRDFLEPESFSYSISFDPLP